MPADIGGQEKLVNRVLRHQLLAGLVVVWICNLLEPNLTSSNLVGFKLEQVLFQ